MAVRRGGWKPLWQQRRTEFPSLVASEVPFTHGTEKGNMNQRELVVSYNVFHPAFDDANGQMHILANRLIQAAVSLKCGKPSSFSTGPVT